MGGIGLPESSSRYARSFYKERTLGLPCSVVKDLVNFKVGRALEALEGLSSVKGISWQEVFTMNRKSSPRRGNISFLGINNLVVRSDLQ